MHRYERGTAVAIILVAVVVMADSFRKSGWTASGPDSGWYPFWSGAVMGVAAAVVLVRSWLAGPSTGAVFSSRDGVIAFGTVLGPMIVFVALLGQLGIYITSAAYLLLFGAVVGKYRWIGLVPLGVGVPAVLYFLFEVGFRFSLPKSLFYARGLLPF